MHHILTPRAPVGAKKEFDETEQSIEVNDKILEFWSFWAELGKPSDKKKTTFGALCQKKKILSPRKVKTLVKIFRIAKIC